MRSMSIKRVAKKIAGPLYEAILKVAQEQPGTTLPLANGREIGKAPRTADHRRFAGLVERGRSNWSWMIPAKSCAGGCQRQ